MLVGILGSGLMGGKLGTVLARAGHEVIFSYARSKEELKRLAAPPARMRGPGRRRRPRGMPPRSFWPCAGCSSPTCCTKQEICPARSS